MLNFIHEHSPILVDKCGFGVYYGLGRNDFWCFQTPANGFFYGGTVEFKNAMSVILICFMTLAIISIQVQILRRPYGFPIHSIIDCLLLVPMHLIVFLSLWRK